MVAGVVLLFLVVAIANGGGNQAPAPVAAPAPVDNPSNTTPVPENDPPAPAVVYEVTGSGKGLMTYGANGNISQENGESLPWKKTLNDKPSGVFNVYALSAQHASGSGPVTCRITVDGKVIAEQTAKGQYAIASCNGSGNGSF